MLFEPYVLRSVTMRNRIAVSPMCEYSSADGFANDWHLVHLGSRAVGGAGLVLTEAAAVSPEGRISPGDLGIYRDDHVEPLRRIVEFVRAQGAASGIQLAHAGRKASVARPWEGGRQLGADADGWRPILAPSAIPFDPAEDAPHALALPEIAALVEAFALAARRSVGAGFDMVEIHAAHGYLIHQFLSPLANHRTDAYGGPFAHRTRLLLDVVDAVRRAIPERMPLLVRISASDWVDGGWTVEDSIACARELKRHGVDLVDCSSGGVVPGARIALGPGYQVPFAARIRREAGIATGAVGMITEPKQADEILRRGDADIVLLARELLRDPYWPLHAAHDLDVDAAWPKQYQRARPPARETVTATR